MDGILSLATASLYEPYLEVLELPESQAHGFEYFGDNATLNEVAQSLVENGFQLHFHTAGDRAVGLALNAIQALSETDESGPHRLTHCYLIDERDRSRFAELGVVADFQLSPGSLEPEYKNFLASDIIGSSRANELLPAKELYEAGALLTLSSDWDADILSPLTKIQAVLTRPDSRSFGTVEDVIPMLTLNAAKLLQQDDSTGSIEVGKFADLVVLEKNIFDIPVEEIGSTKVLLTLLQGEVVFNATVTSNDGKPPPETTSEASVRTAFAAWWISVGFLTSRTLF